MDTFLLLVLLLVVDRLRFDCKFELKEPMDSFSNPSVIYIYIKKKNVRNSRSNWIILDFFLKKDKFTVVVGGGLRYSGLKYGLPLEESIIN